MRNILLMVLIMVLYLSLETHNLNDQSLGQRARKLWATLGQGNA